MGPEAPDNANVIWAGTRRDYVALSVAQGVLWVVLEQEPTGADLRGCFQRALAAGTITTSMLVLVDMARFTGAIDWSAIHAIKDMATWGADGKARVAYVTRNNGFYVLLRVVADLFPRTRHRFFLDPHQAIAWLRA